MSNPQNQTVKVRASFTQEAYISVHDAFEALKAGLGFWDLHSIGIKDGKVSLSMKALEEVKEEPEEKVVIPKSENIGTSLGDLFKNLKL